MDTTISQRELRNDNADIMRRVEQGETFTVTRRGTPLATIVPHGAMPAQAIEQSATQIQELWRKLPATDTESWLAELGEQRRAAGARR